MAKYILIIREDLSKYPIAPEALKLLVDSHVQWANDLVGKGIFVDGIGIKSEGRLLEMADGKVTVNPLRDVKQGIGGYYIVEAPDFNAAIELAKEMPTYHLGDSVEVRALGT